MVNISAKLINWGFNLSPSCSSCTWWIARLCRSPILSGPSSKLPQLSYQSFHTSQDQGRRWCGPLVVQRFPAVLLVLLHYNLTQQKNICFGVYRYISLYPCTSPSTYICDRSRKNPCKAKHVERRIFFSRHVPLVSPLCFKKQASVKLREASVKVPVKLN